METSQDVEPVGKLTYSVREGADRIPCGRDKMYSLVRAGRIKAVRIGRTIRIPVGELERFLEREAR